MALRAQPARWVDILVPRASLARAVQVLAQSGVLELEAFRAHHVSSDATSLREVLRRSEKLAERHVEHQPAPRFRDLDQDLDPVAAARSALARIGRWSRAAGPTVAEIERLELELSQLDVFGDCVDSAEAADVDLSPCAALGPDTSCLLYWFEPPASPPAPGTRHLLRRFDSERRRFVMVVLDADDRPEMESRLADAGGQRVVWPRDVGGTMEHIRRAADERAAALRASLQHQRAQLDALSRRLQIASARGDILRLQWLSEHLGAIPVGDYLASISGWTSESSADALVELLKPANITAVVHLSEPPENRVPPTLPSNPAWAKPFEIFASLAGTPGLGEADPARLLAVMVPLMFGYMFGDVGQGVVIALGGSLLSRRWPQTRILLPCGVAAVGFGFLYGSVFAIEGWLPVLWLHPLDHPLRMLVVPLIGGVVVMVTGLLLSAARAAWAGRLKDWLARDGSLLAFLAGLAGMALTPALGALMLVALAWFIIGSLKQDRRGGIAALLGGAAAFTEMGVQLAINTLSFVRVGAFALAHAGLGSAVVSMMLMLDNFLARALVLLVGNVVIIGLEGLVVSIQTTRLVLFEFFVRFFRAEGRPFRPMLLPK